MMIIIFIELCRIADSLLWIPKSSRRTSSIFYIPNIIALLKMESQQLSQNSPTLQGKCWNKNHSILRIPISWRRTSSIFCIPNIIAFINNGIPTIISTFTHFSPTLSEEVWFIPTIRIAVVITLLSNCCVSVVI
ncbi:HLJ1_G0009720.mRNA.1.CDS.1 [Saccharomyces cerevisiae]|nr:HLJ1_G0009720.mRNA.1.CDS.1 [Saccharomyces cerevisiae]